MSIKEATEVETDEYPELFTDDGGGKPQATGGDEDGKKGADAGSDSGGLPPAAIAAIKDERGKRQEAERRLAGVEEKLAFIEGRLTAQPQQPQQPGRQEPEYDPADFTNYDPWFHRTVDAKVEHKLTAAEQRRKQEREQDWQARLGVSVKFARLRHDDYEDREREFVQMVRSNPALEHEMRLAPDPAEFAYLMAKKHGPSGEAASKDARIAELEEMLGIRQAGNKKQHVPITDVRGSARGSANADMEELFGPSILGDALGGR